MAEVIHLVQGDRKPDIDVTLSNKQTGVAIDVSPVGTTVRLYFRRLGTSTVETITLSKPNGGGDGVVRISWGATSLDQPGEYEGEIEIDFGSSVKQTVYEPLRFHVRPQFA